MLFNSIRKNSHLKYITVDKNDVRTRNTGYLISTIYHGVTYLSMNRCNLGEDGGVSIAEGLARSRHLKTLLLQYNSLSDEAASAFAEAL